MAHPAISLSPEDSIPSDSRGADLRGQWLVDADLRGAAHRDMQVASPLVDHKLEQLVEVRQGAWGASGGGPYGAKNGP